MLIRQLTGSSCVHVRETSQVRLYILNHQKWIIVHANHVEVDHLKLVVKFYLGRSFNAALRLMLLQGQLLVVRIYGTLRPFLLSQEPTQSCTLFLLVRREL